MAINLRLLSIYWSQNSINVCAGPGHGQLRTECSGCTGYGRWDNGIYALRARYMSCAHCRRLSMSTPATSAAHTIAFAWTLHLQLTQSKQCHLTRNESKICVNRLATGLKVFRSVRAQRTQYSVSFGRFIRICLKLMCRASHSYHVHHSWLGRFVRATDCVGR